MTQSRQLLFSYYSSIIGSFFLHEAFPVIMILVSSRVASGHLYERTSQKSRNDSAMTFHYFKQIFYNIIKTSVN